METGHLTAMIVRTLLAAFAALFALAAPAPAQSFNAQEQAEIRAVVRQYLVDNPDVLQEALDALETRVAAQRRIEIERDRRDFSIGPADAPITIVEFYDYRCPYCHSAYEWVNDLIRTRRDVRIVFKELPILSQESLEASRAALAAMPQGRYLQFHAALMAFRGDLTSARIDAIARQSGVDVPRMRRAMNDPASAGDINDHINQNREQAINLAGGAPDVATPLFMINGELVRGFRPDELQERLRDASREARRTPRS